MRILSRYIGLSILGSTATVLGVLLALFTFFTFADELTDTGKGAYTALDALIYSMSTMPRMAYQLFPAAALIGTMMGLGMLAGHGELTAMRAAGVSLAAIVRSVLRVGVVMMLVVLLVGEWLAPRAEQYAETMRSLALSQKVSLQTDTGLWVRDGNSFINIRELHAGGRVGRITIYELDADERLQTITHASGGVYQPKKDEWRLEQLQVSHLSEEGVRMEEQSRASKASLLSPAMLDVVMIEPEAMSLWALYQYVGYLQANGLDARKYQQAMWVKLVSPFSTLVMVLLAVPFIFGSQRTKTAGHRVLMGTMMGIGFHLLNQVSGYVGLVFEINPLLAATAPTLLFFTAALYMLRKVR